MKSDQQLNDSSMHSIPVSLKQQKPPDLFHSLPLLARYSIFLHTLITTSLLKKDINNNTHSHRSFPQLPSQFKVQQLAMDFNQQLAQVKDPTWMSVIWLLISKFPWLLFFGCLSCVIYSLILIIQTILLNEAINLQQNGQMGMAFAYTGGFIVLQFFSMQNKHIYFYIFSQLTAKVKAVLIYSLYSTTINFSQFKIKSQEIGKIINLLSSDLAIFQGKIYFVANFITIPFIFAAALPIIISRLGLWGIFVLLTPLSAIIFSFLNGYMTSSVLSQLNKLKDLRIKKTNQLIQGIRIIKLYGWEDAFQNMIVALRTKQQWLFTKLFFFQNFQRAINISITPNMCFVAFIVIFHTTNQLTSGKIFSTLQLINSFRLLVMAFGMFGLQHIFELKVLFTRFSQICLKEKQCSAKSREPEDKETCFQFVNYSAFWEKIKQPNDNHDIKYLKPALSKISLKLKFNLLHGLMGKVGSGKSSFISAILSEVPRSQGQFKKKRCMIAYVQQEPFIFNGTFEQNIIFGNQKDQSRIADVCKACQLFADIEQLPKGLLTQIGQRGVNLSGGQKARLSLARALYSQSDVYLFDDPISALDAKVGRKVFFQAIKQYLSGKTIILNTHQVQYSKHMDYVVVLKQGQVMASGNPLELKQQNLEELGSKDQGQLKDQPIQREKINVVQQEQSQNLIGNEFMTFVHYVLDQRWYMFLATFVFCVFQIICYLGAIRTYSYYSPNQSYDYNIKIFIAVGSFLCVYVFAYFSFLFLTFISCVFNNSVLHKRMIRTLLRMPVSYFDSNSSGKILNKFSNDLFIMDFSVPFTLLDCLDGIVLMTLIIANIIQITPYSIISIALALFLIIFIAIYFKPVINFCKKYQLSNKSPVFTLFNTTLAGILQIRNYNKQNYFLAKFRKALDQANRFFLAFSMISRGLGYSLGVASYVTCSATILIILGTIGKEPLFGVSMLYILTAIDYIQWIIRQLINLDAYMVSASRIKQFCCLQLQNYDPEGQAQALNDSTSALKIQALKFRYKPNLPLVLNGLDLNITRGMKVGVVGRTGSGKSSLINAIFRIAPPQPGSKVFLFGKETSQVPLKDIRSSISIIPQSTFMFIGTIRQNLDPFDEYDQDNLWKALKEAGLKEYVQSLPQKLQTKTNSNQDLFSTGQKQLLCLARAIIRNNDFLILDEATSNVDYQTDQKIQSTLKTVFSKCTILTIAHRLSTIANYDWIIVMRAGNIIQQGPPLKLLLADERDDHVSGKSQFAEIVRSAGDQMARTVLRIARSG